MSNALLARFIPEARDLLQSSASGLLRLEKSPADATAINEVFRAVHTLKGSSGLFDAVALTRLVHAAEDLLGEVRSAQRELDSDLVDMLLDSLDQVSAWIDHLERHERLPDDADRVCKAAVGRLRDRLAPAEAPASSDPPAEEKPAAEIGWIADMAEADRLALFSDAARGHPVLAVHYVPAETCFYNGEDPFGLVLQVPGLGALDVVTREPWPPLEELDPYRCNLAFRLLASGARVEVEHLFRYVSDEVRIDQVAPDALIRLAGAPAPGPLPVVEDFAEEARACLERRDWAALRTATAALLALTNPELSTASALRWLDAVSAAPFPNAAHAAALIEAVATGEPPRLGSADVEPPRPVLATLRPRPGTVPADARDAASGDVEALARRIVAAQRCVLAEAQALDRVRAHVGAVATVLARLLPGRADDGLCARIAAAARVAETDGDAGPLLDLLGTLDDATDGGTAAATTVAPGTASVVPAPGADASAGEAARDERGAARMLKVDQAKVDLLMNLIGELVVSKNSLPFLARRAEHIHGSREMAREIKDQYAVIDRLAQEMQGAIMQVRMLPVSEVFDRFPRLVRDLARKLEKRIDLVVEGEDTAADKTIIEALGDPLLHVVRNAIDHGIEPPAERRAAGKPEQATIVLKASQEADHVAIEVRDDGRGIDPAKVRAAAVAKGVVDAGAAEALSDQEAIRLIFRPGFSTAAKVSDLSGRGVGLDVVLTTVEKLGGRVAVTSRSGEGTTVRIAMPLSMAVTRVMVVEVGGEPYGIPMDIIAETVRVPRERIKTIKQAPAFVLRDTVVPLLRLARTLGCGTAAADVAAEAVLVCRIGGAPIGLVVDNFREGMDVILKPFDGVLAGMRGFSGTALLGDGHVLLVLDLKELL
ncbi:Signal transduction histidine kinase CheA [Rhodovulum sp. PH10]|uniref:chemotaxis protein CheA n=1 Tax=Rhodovulum sp. PH10 TaxID=1187851 RepID=UPI00027C2211|nr:chemotaxis protein CheA [Rhodovulum sp. PH10]EJW10869.1 Signal transduction histidine kinase CheA [Rhodovulum sp. PH10]